MRRVILLVLALLPIMFVGCDNDDDNITQSFQLWGDEAEIPSLYFWDGNSNSDPKISGTAKGEYEIEIVSDSSTDAEISGVFHLGYSEVGRFYKNDILKESFKIKKGENFIKSGSFSFYGGIFDKAFILVDIETYSPVELKSCPATIKSTNVRIMK